MPRHFDRSSRWDRSSSWGRLARLTSIALVVVLVAGGAVAGGIWWIATYASGATAAAGLGNPQQAPASSTSGTPTVSSPAPGSPTPSTAIETTPAAKAMDSLAGLVPDYVLPPVENGMVPVLTRIPTEQKVVFLSIDDGAIKRESDLALLEEQNIKASLFLAHTFIAAEPEFYAAFIAAGHLVENHSMTHNLGFIHLDYDGQKAEICGMADFAESHYGRRPVFFRPPGGPYTQATRQAAAACGMKAIVDWEAKANAGEMDYQVGAVLRPGDIVLMHFRPEFEQDLAAFVTAQKAAGLQVVLLEDYLATR